MDFKVEINGLPVSAHYSQESIDGIFLPFLRKLTELQKKLGRRIFVLLAAPPGAGKSTLCEFLKYLTAQDDSLLPVTVIGMDGFHHRQEYLLSHTALRDGKEIPLVSIKGAPVTFDLPLLTERMKRVAAGEECGWPAYNRLTHNPQENAVAVTGNIVLLEGNYLLLDEPGWRELKELADFTVKIVADAEDLRPRLVARKTASGVSPEAACEFVEHSDLWNAQLCLEHSLPADLTLFLQHDGEYTAR